MSKVDEKLHHFANDIMLDVGEERRVLVEQVDEEIRQIYLDKEDEYLNKAYEIIQNALITIEQKKNASISRINMGNRSKLFDKRSEILTDVYGRVIEALKGFKETEAYKGYLIKKINHAVSLLGEGAILVKLDRSDIELKGFVETETGYLVEVDSKRIQHIGGCIVYNRETQTIVDHTFSRRLEDAKTEFIQQCQLKIE